MSCVNLTAWAGAALCAIAIFGQTASVTTREYIYLGDRALVAETKSPQRATWIYEYSVGQNGNIAEDFKFRIPKFQMFDGQPRELNQIHVRIGDCYVITSAAGHMFLNDNGSWLGPMLAWEPKARGLQDNKCVLDFARSASVPAGDDILATVAVVFKPGFQSSGTSKPVQVLTQYVGGNPWNMYWYGWIYAGDFVMNAAPGLSFAPNLGQGNRIACTTGSANACTFVAAAQPVGSQSDVSPQIHIRFGDDWGCHVIVGPGGNAFFLVDSTYGYWGGPAFGGQNVVLDSGNCKLRAAESGVTPGALPNTVNINLSLEFSGHYVGTKTVQMWSLAGNGVWFGWADRGSWTLH